MNNEQTIPVTGGIQSPEDYRYVNVAHLAAIGEPTAYPRSAHVQFEAQVPKLNQRAIGACTNHAAAEIKMHRDIRLTGGVKAGSPRLTYTLCKINDGIEDQSNQGTYYNMPLKMGVNFGWASEATVPNQTTLTFDQYIYNRSVASIPAAGFAEADDNRFPGYAQVGAFNSVSAIQLVAAFNMNPDGVKIGLQVGSEWWTDKNGNWSYSAADLLPIRPCVNPVSGHDIWMTGYEYENGTDRLKVFFRNHWGENWGDHGNGWLYLDEHPLVEAWVVTEIPNALLAIVKSLPARENFKALFNVDLKPGMQSADVKNLQIALKILGAFPFNQAVTDYFGNITKGAVQKFQTTYKVASPAEIVAAAGTFGPKSRAILNKLMSQN